jgi:cadmium resistance protein CadD (predicted permease)
MAAGLAADLGIAAAAFFGTNIDNGLVAMAMVAAAPPERARRIALGQVFGFVVLVAVAAASSAALFEFSARIVGLLGLVPLALGMRGLLLLRHPEGRADAVSRRAVGRGFMAASLVTIAAGGDNLAAYIPLFRVGGVTNFGATAIAFATGEVMLTAFVLSAGRQPHLRQVAGRLGTFAVPILMVAVGVLVLIQAGTLSLVL